MVWSRVLSGTHRDGAPDARPQGVVGQLAPAARVRDGPLVEDAAEDVDEHGDEEDDGEDAARPDGPGRVRLDARAGVVRAHLEEVGALVRVGAHERRRRLRVQRVVVAQERNGRRLAPSSRRRRCCCCLRWRRGRGPGGRGGDERRAGAVHPVLLVFILVVFVLRAIVDGCAGGALVVLVGIRATGRAAGVLEDELAASRGQMGGLLAVVSR